ncbi:heavy-metal-associated domain-containing protein [Euzebya tangerina]|uniref:heavy-metal-associated domain-containing protein n=1 Tax=Euzebya tangerina TaxID=591198 RepID=UPI000E31E28F|nr:cation transporter [Euzebya tangerina]
MQTTDTISVPEIHCDHCKTSIEGALNPLDGITEATVDVQDASVTVTFDPALIDRRALVGAIEDQGYEVPS